MGAGHLILPDGTPLPLGELRLRFSRSAGPGGQNVNRRESRVELDWEIAGSRALSAEQKERLAAGLAGRLDSRGVLHLACQQTRSQHRNRTLLLERLARLAASALRPRRARRPTHPSPSSRERRLAEKARRARLKRLRRLWPEK